MKLSKPISLPTLFLLIVLIFQAFMSASSQMSSSEFFQHIRNRDPQNPSTFEQIVLATSNVATTLATAASVCVSVVLCCPCISGALCCVGTCKCAKRVKTLLVDQCPYNQPPQPYQHHQPQQHHHQQQVDPLLGHHPETLQAPPSPPRYPAAAAAAAGVEVGGESGILQDSPRKEKYPRVSPHRYNFEGKSSSDVHFQDDQNIIPGAPAAAQEQNQATATSHAYARQKSSPNRNSLFSFSHSHVPAAAAAAAAAGGVSGSGNELDAPSVSISISPQYVAVPGEYVLNLRDNHFEMSDSNPQCYTANSEVDWLLVPNISNQNQRKHQ